MSKFNPNDYPIHVEAHPVDSIPSGPYGSHIEFNASECRRYLAKYGWTTGLIELFILNAQKIGSRYFLLDDSGSMTIADGHLPLSISRVPVSRWSELGDSMRFHIGLLDAAALPAQIRFLNATSPHHPIHIGAADPQRVGKSTTDTIFNESPGGLTPLCQHIREIVRNIRKEETKLREERKKAIVMIATDGLSSDGDVLNALKPLEQLPVWLIVKLCTDDESIVDYWNQVDQNLEVPMDVLDDFRSEAEEVSKSGNGWLTYGLPIHRMRESGLLSKEFDLLDEAKLSHDDMLTVVAGVLGAEKASYPHPALDWKAFFAHVDGLSRAVDPAQTPDPMRGLRNQNWINMSKLNRAYAPGMDKCAIH